MDPITLFSEEILLQPATFFLIFLPFLFFILKHLKHSFLSKSPPLPPGPFQWPIIGNIFQIGKNPHKTFARFAQTYGPLFSLKLGTQLVIVASSPAAASEILKTHDRNLSARYVPHALMPPKSSEDNNLSVGLGWGDFNDNRRNLRAICRTELFSGKEINFQASVRDQKVAEMLEFVHKRQGKEVKIKELVLATILNMMGNILVSRDLVNLEHESMNGEIYELVKEGVDVTSAPNISDFYPILRPFDLQNLKKRSMESAIGFCKLWWAILEERKEEKDTSDASNPQDFVDVLIKNGATHDQINILFLELFSAGTETSSSTVEWTMVELLKNQKSMMMVKEELAREIKQEVVKECDLPKLKYLDACVKEILRLHPPGPLFLPHRAAETCQVMNYTIPKDTEIIVNFWAIGRDPKYWEDPLVFKPERFLNSSLDFRGNDFEFIPFSSGRRMCPGMPMAMKHIPLIIASLIHSFDWCLPAGNDPKDIDMTDKYGHSMRKFESLVLIPKAKI
ncbi:hypothetical protein UlMin_033157 [Ulmus minor]